MFPLWAYFINVNFLLIIGENCTVKKVNDSVIIRLVVLTCPSLESTQDSKFCCYDSSENVECCNAVERIQNM